MQQSDITLEQLRELLSRYAQPCAEDCDHSQCPLLRELHALGISRMLDKAQATVKPIVDAERKGESIGDLMSIRLDSHTTPPNESLTIPDKIAMNPTVAARYSISEKRDGDVEYVRVETRSIIDVAEQHDFVQIKGSDRCGLRGCVLGVLEHAWIPPWPAAASSPLPAEPAQPDPFAMSRCALVDRNGFPCGWCADDLIHTDSSLRYYHQFQTAPAPAQPEGE